MNCARWGLALLLGLMGAGAWAQGLVFAVNEGVTYRVSNDEIRARYAAIAAPLAKNVVNMLKTPKPAAPRRSRPS